MSIDVKCAFHLRAVARDSVAGCASITSPAPARPASSGSPRRRARRSTSSSSSARRSSPTTTGRCTRSGARRRTSRTAGRCSNRPRSCLHLADRHPEAGLIAEPGSHERALQYQWAFFAMTELEAPLVDAAREMWKDSGEPDTERMAAACARFANGAARRRGVAGRRRPPRRGRLLGRRHHRRRRAQLRAHGRDHGAAARPRALRRRPRGAPGRQRAYTRTA